MNNSGRSVITHRILLLKKESKMFISWMPKMSFTVCVCQGPCNPTSINNNCDSGEGNRKRSEVICEKCFTKWKGKDRTKNQLENYINFKNSNLLSLCIVTVSINLNLHRDAIKIQ